VVAGAVTAEIRGLVGGRAPVVAGRRGGQVDAGPAVPGGDAVRRLEASVPAAGAAEQVDGVPAGGTVPAVPMESKSCE